MGAPVCLTARLGRRSLGPRLGRKHQLGVGPTPAPGLREKHTRPAALSSGLPRLQARTMSPGGWGGAEGGRWMACGQFGAAIQERGQQTATSACHWSLTLSRPDSQVHVCREKVEAFYGLLTESHVTRSAGIFTSRRGHVPVSRHVHQSPEQGPSPEQHPGSGPAPRSGACSGVSPTLGLGGFSPTQSLYSSVAPGGLDTGPQ